MRILQTVAVKHKAPIVTHEYLMSLTILSANTKCCAVPNVADHADFIPGPQLQNGMEYELQTFTVTSSLHDVSEFVRIVRIPDIRHTARHNYGHLCYRCNLKVNSFISKCIECTPVPHLSYS